METTYIKIRTLFFSVVICLSLLLFLLMPNRPIQVLILGIVIGSATCGLVIMWKVIEEKR